jgi:hypothetical protein
MIPERGRDDTYEAPRIDAREPIDLPLIGRTSVPVCAVFTTNN